MKRLSVVLVVLVMLVACLFAATTSSSQAQAPEPVCTVQLLNIVCVQAGVQVLNQPLAIPTVRITLPPLTVPGPTRTVTVSPNPVRPTATVTQRVTETAPGAPGATRTIQGPTTTVTKTVGPQKAPQATVTTTATPQVISSTETVTASPGQPTPTPGTLVPGGTRFFPDSIPPPVVKAGVGIGILLALAALILLGMYGGYYLGYKDKDKKEAKFLRALLNKE